MGGPAAVCEPPRGPMLPKCLVWRELLRRGLDPGAAGPPAAGALQTAVPRRAHRGVPGPGAAGCLGSLVL